MSKYLLFCSVLGTWLNAQVGSIDENFNNFPVDQFSSMGGGYGELPYGGWSSDKKHPNAFITEHSTTKNRYLKAYTLFDAQSPIYFFTPELLSVEGKLSFYAGTSGGSLEVGVVADINDLTGFQSVKSFELGGSLSKFEVDIPSSSTAKFIAFKYQTNGVHKVFGLDNVVFEPKNLSVQDALSADVKMALNPENQRVYFQGDKLRKVEVFDGKGGLVKMEKVRDNSVDVSSLAKGVYFIVMETEEGTVLKSKFIK